MCMDILQAFKNITFIIPFITPLKRIKQILIKCKNYLNSFLRNIIYAFIPVLL